MPDFEVIVCDNHTTSPCQREVEAFNDPRIRYVVPERPLAMFENWEFATGLAVGDFALVLID
jgi:hypothetical protein